MVAREDYQARMERELAVWQREAARLKACAAEMDGQGRAEYETSLAYVKLKEADARGKFENLKKVEESAWARVKLVMDSAGGEFKEALDRMANRFQV